MLGTFALVVDYADLGEIVVLVTCQPYAPREVNVLAVHEIGFVKETYFLKSFTTQHKECTGQDVDWVCFVIVEMPHIVSGKPARVGEQFCQATHFVERGSGSWEAPFALFQKFSFAVYHLYCQASTVAVLGKEVGTTAKGVAFHQRVGVQQQHQIATASAQGLVVGGGKSAVVLVCNQVNLGIALTNHFHRPVHRVVVNYKHFKFQRSGIPLKRSLRVEYRLQTLVKEILDVVVDDYYAQCHAHA